MTEFMEPANPSPTTRLNFSEEIDDQHVPAFLRGGRPRLVVVDDISEKEHKSPKIQEQESPAPVLDPKVTPQPVHEEHAEETIHHQDPVEVIQEVEAAAYITPAALDGLSVEELRKQKEALDKAILEKQIEERREVIKQIVDVVNTYKIPVEDLVEALGGLKVKRKGVKATVKYRDPISGETWSGRGKEPVWIRNKNRNDFLIS